MEKICKNCKHYDNVDYGGISKEYKTCYHILITSEADEHMKPHDEYPPKGGIHAGAGGTYEAVIFIDENFGCIHFDQKNE